MKQKIDNDSPRQPVWQMRPVQPAAAPGPDRRCLCGARPNPAGILPCNH